MCEQCTDPNCDGKLDSLRAYSDWSDLASHCSEETIVEFVSCYAKLKRQQKEYGKRHRARAKHFTDAAKELLSSHELEEIERALV